jgi:hypothetical protein
LRSYAARTAASRAAYGSTSFATSASPAARPVTIAVRMPCDDRGSNDIAASPVASQPSPYADVSRPLRADTTRGSGVPRTADRTCAVASAAAAKPGPERSDGGTRSASVRYATTRHPSGTRAVYHHPDGEDSTSVVASSSDAG